MKKTLGILAHVDAGKTTFSEQLLYNTGSIRNLGRVDHKTSYMDTDEIEIRRGITVFADVAVFNYKKDTYYLIDTPGHVDFSAETERAISALDYGIILIDGNSGVQAHTTTLFRLLRSYKVPTFLFINKTDINDFNLENTLDDIKNKLTDDILYVDSIEDIYNLKQDVAEFCAERNEIFMEAYFEENYNSEYMKKTIIELINSELCFPVMSGSALKGEGIDSFLEVFSKLSLTNYENKESSSFIGKVHKIRHDDKGNRLTFIKALSGKLQVKDEFTFEKDGEIYGEKINEIRMYNGQKYESKDTVCAGDVFAIAGLKTSICGSVLKDGKIKLERENYYLVPTLQSKINILDGTDSVVFIEKLRLLEAEDPMLSVSFKRESEQILVSVMGKIQLEVLKQLVFTRFGVDIDLEKPQVQYKESISAPVVGYGHFEPLRHYAEVQLRLEPNVRGKGITYENECHVDNLPLNYQRLVEKHVFEKKHKGVLTGSPITDINIVLQDGRAHIKHTEGGDFREATYRAIRQGLEKTESILLEPFYKFEIYVEESYVGKVISDIQKLRGTFDSPIQNNNIVCIKGRGPVDTFMEYSTQLVSATKGNGSISFLFDGYDLCENSQEIIEKIQYDKERDTENVSSSVFCAKGTSFVVPWQEAEEYMHTI